jgi:RNA polymerase sigma factor (sigma-70 family)
VLAGAEYLSSVISPAQLAEHTFRHEYGRLVAILSKRFGYQHLEDIEDVVQSSLLKAMHTWARQGVPENASAWLYRAARHELLDRLRRQQRWNKIAHQLQHQAQEAEALEEPAIDPLDDAQLRMLFVACDPALSVEAQITFALKTLCGFSIPEIAHALLTTEAGIYKRLTRAREALQQAALNPAEYDISHSLERLSAVQTILYLLFNEGYNSHHPDQLIRYDLCEEAVRLTQFLLDFPATATPETKALFALMFLHAGRFQSRMNEAGTLVLLDEQDRTLWDWSLIRVGCNWLEQASTGETITKYHLEAAIAAEHCHALKFEDTHWAVIDRCYETLYRMEPTAVHALNRAIALSYLHGPRAGLAWLAEQQPEAPAGYHHWPAAVGELHRRLGDHATARKYFQEALAMTPPPVERAFLEKRREQCRS